MNKNTERSRQFRQKRIDAGLCVYCGMPNPTALRGCPDCMEKRRNRQKKQYSEMSDEKKAEYIRKNTERNKFRYIRLRREGLCIRCKNPVENGDIHCAVCKEKDKAYQKSVYGKWYKSEKIGGKNGKK